MTSRIIARRRLQNPIRIDEFSRILRFFARSTGNHEFEDFAALVDALGADEANLFLDNRPPSVLWIKRCIQRLPAAARVTGSGAGIVLGVLDRDMVLVDRPKSAT